MGNKNPLMEELLPAAQAPPAQALAGRPLQSVIAEPLKDDRPGARNGDGQAQPPSLSLDHLATISLEAVLSGCLMRLEFRGGVNPAGIPLLLRSLDPNVKLRDDFPRGGMGGKRDTLLARAIVINAEVKDSGKFIDLTCQGADALKVTVSKKAADEWLGKLEALGKLEEANLQKLKNAFEAKKSATVFLSEDEQFGVLYFEIDGKAYLDGMQAEPPAAEEGKATP